MRPIPYSHLFRSCLLVENAVRGAPRYVTRRLMFLVSVNPPCAGVKTKKKQEVHRTRPDVRIKKTRDTDIAKTTQVVLEEGKKRMKRLRLPMAIPETKGESKGVDIEGSDHTAMPPDSTVDGNTMNEACTATTLSSVAHGSVQHTQPKYLLLCLPTRSFLCSLAFPVN